MALGAWFALPGLVGLDGRWNRARIVLQSQMLGVGLILLGAGRAWGDFRPANPLTWAFVLGREGYLGGLQDALKAFIDIILTGD